MLDEKTMVSDALTGVNGELVRYGEMIPQTENKELKQCLKQIRNQLRGNRLARTCFAVLTRITIIRHDDCDFT